MGFKIHLRDLKLESLFLFVVVDLKPSEHIAVTAIFIAFV